MSHRRRRLHQTGILLKFCCDGGVRRHATPSVPKREIQMSPYLRTQLIIILEFEPQLLSQSIAGFFPFQSVTVSLHEPFSVPARGCFKALSRFSPHTHSSNWLARKAWQRCTCTKAFIGFYPVTELSLGSKASYRREKKDQKRKRSGPANVVVFISLFHLYLVRQSLEI